MRWQKINDFPAPDMIFCDILMPAPWMVLPGPARSSRKKREIFSLDSLWSMLFIQGWACFDKASRSVWWGSQGLPDPSRFTKDQLLQAVAQFRFPPIKGVM
jgi:hypothetical protein